MALRFENESQQKSKVTIASLFAEHEPFKSKIAAEEADATGPLTRELWSLQSVVNPARHRIKAARIKMQAEIFDLSREAAKAHEKVEAAKQEVARFAAITHAGLIKHVLRELRR